MSDLLKAAAWAKLDGAATDYATGRTKAQAQALSNAAKTWAAVADAETSKPKTSGRVVGTRGNVLRSGEVVPFGNSKGKPIEEESDKSLEWLRNAIASSVDDPSKERWREKNQKLLDAIEAELDARSGGDTPNDDRASFGPGPESDAF